VGHEEEQTPRVILGSVCFALTAADSETLEGRSVSLGSPTVTLRPYLLTLYPLAVSSRMVGLGFSTG